MAVRGFNEPGGDFVVSDVCFAAPAPQPAAPPLQPFESAGSGPARSSDKYVALMSGLAVGSPSTNVLQVRSCVWKQLALGCGTGTDMLPTGPFPQMTTCPHTCPPIQVQPIGSLLPAGLPAGLRAYSPIVTPAGLLTRRPARRLACLPASSLALYLQT